MTITTDPDLHEQRSANGPEDNRYDEPKRGACNGSEEEQSAGQHERDVSQTEEDGPAGTEHDEVQTGFEVTRGVTSFAIWIAVFIERATKAGWG